MKRLFQGAGLIALLILLIAAGMLGARWVLQANADVSGTASQYDPTAREGRGSREQPTERVISSLQQALEKNPYIAENWALLGAAFLQRVRENGDPGNYSRAEQAIQKALDLEPNNFSAVAGMGGLSLARHEFQDALTWGQRGAQLNPYNAGIYGVIGDAHLELGEYDAAFENFQKMVDTRPGLSSYARVSYARELSGDRDGAVENMKAAVTAGGLQSEARSWALVQLGNLYFDRGDLVRAHQAYQAALENWNDYPYARGGLARVYAARGEYAQAIETYTRLIQAIPLPEFVIGLGDVYDKSGDADNANRQYALVGAMQQLFQSNGVNTDAELALFNADHRVDLDATLALAHRAYTDRPGIFVADTLAWTLYQTGDYQGALEMIDRALELGTQNALMFYHAGMIHYQLGNVEQARSYLEKAIALNPHFSLRYGDSARSILKELSATGNR